MPKALNSRAAAAKLSWQIIDKGKSLDAALTDHFADANSDDRSFVQELVYGVCRWYGELDGIAAQLLNKPIRNKDRVVHYVLLVGLYQLKHLQTADHAAVSETVEACQQLNKQWAKNLINGCLRRWQRDTESAQELQQDVDERAGNYSHPEWLADQIKANWPDHWRQILAANNDRPPMTLRANANHGTREHYLQLLAQQKIDAIADPRSADAIHLHQAVPVLELPGFADGAVSVQDIAAQIAADVLSPKSGESVLDACAAPGGKATHLLERCSNKLRLDALDISETRVARMQESFLRLKLSGKLYTADAAQNPSWPTPESGYDHVIIDAPCSGTGVIRRHPDIKHHRRPEDILALNQTQARLLQELWKLVKPNGQLLYLTCSILASENEQQIDAFLSKHKDAEVTPFTHPQAFSLQHGKQTLQGVHNMDGFYYCLLRKMGS